jgi:hypothetical protein
VEDWQPKRASTHSPEFLSALSNLGIKIEDADNVISRVEATLLGADLNRLEDVYPPDDRGRRLVLTEAAPGVPALRLAFLIDMSDEEQVVFLAAAIRETG